MRRQFQSYDAHLFKLLLQMIQEKFEFKALKTEKQFYELARLISIGNGLDSKCMDESRFYINPRTLMRYYGVKKWGNGEMRYSPNPMCLDVLARCIIGNKRNPWDYFTMQPEYNNKTVDLIFPHELKYDFHISGYNSVNDMKVDEVRYFGNVTKYLAIQKLPRRNKFQIVDFKNCSPKRVFEEIEISNIQISSSNDGDLRFRLNFRLPDSSSLIRI